MARNKQTFAQQFLGIVTYGMPAPVRQVVTSRWVSTLIIIVVPALVLTGIVTISWTGGRPNFTVNKQRAEQVEREVEQQATRAAQELRSLQDARRR
jgi:hypothetical protein